MQWSPARPVYSWARFRYMEVPAARRGRGQRLGVPPLALGLVALVFVALGLVGIPAPVCARYDGQRPSTEESNKRAPRREKGREFRENSLRHGRVRLILGGAVTRMFRLLWWRRIVQNRASCLSNETPLELSEARSNS